MNSVLLIGATSDIAKATAEEYASRGFDLILSARDKDSLEKVSQDLRIRHQVRVATIVLDVLDIENHEKVLNSIEELPNISIVYVGYLGDQEVAQKEMSEAAKIINVNFTAIVSVCNFLANQYESKGEGELVVFSSVAGERGRQSNYLYGSAKAGLNAYLSGLRNRLSRTGVHVMTVLPGFMATKMTEGLNLPGVLTAQPSEVAKSLVKAIDRRKNVVYIKWVWRYIMMIIKNIPEPIFKKLSL